MNPNKRTIVIGIGLSVVIVLVSVVAFQSIFLHEQPEPSGDRSRIHTRVDFDGQFSVEPQFNINGTIGTYGIGQRQTRFNNLSIRLYREDGTLIKSQCLGTLTYEHNIYFSLRSEELPKYVVFVSPEFWTKPTVDDFQVDYFYYGNGNYLPITWTEPSDVSIDLKRHRPCQNTDQSR